MSARGPITRDRVYRLSITVFVGCSIFIWLYWAYNFGLAHFESGRVNITHFPSDKLGLAVVLTAIALTSFGLALGCQILFWREWRRADPTKRGAPPKIPIAFLLCAIAMFWFLIMPTGELTVTVELPPAK